MIGAVADARGEAVAVLDWNAFRFGIDAFRVEIKRDDFDLIGVSALTSQYKYVKQIVPILREAHPDAVIMLGGGILTSQPEDMMKWLDIDVGVIGEGENTMHELLDVVFSRRFGEVRGIIYRDEKGRIKRSEPRPLIGMKDCGFYEKLDDLPYPAWELSPLEVYLRNSSIPLGPYAIRATARFDVSTERGCPKRCDFCQHLGMSSWDLGRIWNRKFIGPPVRFFSAKYVVDMVKQLRFKYKADFISFLDENFLINKKRAFEIAELWEEEGLAGLVRFGCLGSVDAADYDLLQKLRDVGLDYVSYGGECANDYVLKSMGKNTTVVQMQDAIDNTMKAGVNPIMTFMVGHPSDSLESVYDTIQFFIRNQINCVPFFCTPYVGTQLYEKHKDKILEQYDGDLEAYVTALDDATQFCVNLTKWNDAELIGLKDMMARCDLRALKRFAELKNEKVGGL